MTGIDINAIPGVKTNIAHTCACCGNGFSAYGWRAPAAAPWPTDLAGSYVCGVCWILGTEAIVAGIRKRHPILPAIFCGPASLGFGDKRRARKLTEVCPKCSAAVGASCVDGVIREHLLHIVPIIAEPFPIEDAGPHPKDSE